jgi:hypothetical protein
VDLPLFFTLPLIGGFAFVTTLWSLRWRSARQDSQRLYYRAAIYGVLIAIGVGVGHALLFLWSAYRDGFEWLYTSFLGPLFTTKDSLPELALRIRAHVALTCVYALAFGILAPLVLNGAVSLWGRRRGRDSRVSANLASITDPLESVLSRSLLNGEAIQVTLSTGKVYVGYVLEAPDPDLPTKFIRLQPLMSGQRTPDGQVDYTTFYDRILSDFEANPATKGKLDTFQQVVPVDKVVTLSGFDLDAYVHFLSEREERGDETAEPSPQAALTLRDLCSTLAGIVVARMLR